MPIAELIAIGTELLLGEIQDTNTRYIARLLRDNNIDLFRSSIIGDNSSRITSLIREALGRANIVITTGGLGPTVDDPTREAAAQAWNVALEFHPELWEQIQSRFRIRNANPSDNNRRQAFLPASSIPVPNPVGTAPAFILEDEDHCLICLPGVPHEMETLIQLSVLPYLKKKFNLHGIIKARVLHIAGVPESKVDELVGEFESLSNPTVGLLAHPGIVDVRITAKADSEAIADDMISKLEDTIRSRFPEEIFGVDEDTLQDQLLLQVETVPGKTEWLIKGFGISDIQFHRSTPISLNIEEILEPIDHVEMNKVAREYVDSHKVDRCFTSFCCQFADGFHLFLCIITKTETVTQEKIYNGPPAQNIGWSVNNSLDFLRRQFLHINERTD